MEHQTESVAFPVVEMAIRHLGGAAKVAQRRGLKTRWGVAKWWEQGLPAEHVLWLAEQTGWTYTPHQLKPDLYPHPNDGLPRELRRRESAAVEGNGVPEATDILMRNGATAVVRA